MFKKISHFIYWLLKAKKSGLDKTPKDDRDFNVSLFGWHKYQPKHERFIIPTVSVKNQRALNNCVFQATTVQKENDEKIPLSARSLTIKAKALGYVRGNGYSNLRSGQKVLQKWGILEESQCNSAPTSWNTYTSFQIGRYNKEASKHKIASYWAVNNREEILKLLDDKKIITTGLNWYSSFNQSGGFRSPWIINKDVQRKGYKVGGHAVALIGYDLNYHGKEVYIAQNSYGRYWGDKGKFYIEMDYLANNNYGFFTNLDEIDKELAGFLTSYDGKNVKGSSSTIYFVQHGKLKAYPDELTYLAFNVRDSKIRNWTQVDDSLIKRAKKGDNMDIKKSLYWDFLKDVDNQHRLNKLIQIISKK